MAITIIVCTHNRCRILRNTLANLAASVLPDGVDWEVLVVDNNSQDQTPEVVEGFCRQYPGRFRYLFESRQGKSYALNTGVRKARGDVIAFTDDDVTVEPTWLWNLTAPLNDDQWAGTGGRILPAQTFVPPQWMSLTDRWMGDPLGLFDLGDKPGPLDRAPRGGNMAFRKAMFEKYGGFMTDLGPPPNDLGGTDTEFGDRLIAAGERLQYEPSAVAHHSVTEDQLEKNYFLGWWFQKGRSNIRIMGYRPSPIGGVPGHYVTILKRVLRRLSVPTVQWLANLDPRLRFKRKCQVYRIAGEMRELVWQSGDARKSEVFTASERPYVMECSTSLGKDHESNGARVSNLLDTVKAVSRGVYAGEGNTNSHVLRQAPLFSIILPTRNRASMLQRAVSSVLRQSLSEFELIIIDDASIEPFSGLPQDPRIRIIRNAVHLGAAEARNRGIDAARGTYISFLDDDDEYLSSFLSSTYAVLRNSANHVGISWSGVKFIDYSREVGIAPKERVQKYPADRNRYALLRDLLSIGLGFGVTIKAECLARVGPFNNLLKVTEDTDMFFRILTNGFMPIPVPGVHVVCHNHNKNRLSCPAMREEHIRACEWLWAQHSDFLFENPKLRAQFRAYVDWLKVRPAYVEASRMASDPGKMRRWAPAFLSWGHPNS